MKTKIIYEIKMDSVESLNYVTHDIAAVFMRYFKEQAQLDLKDGNVTSVELQLYDDMQTLMLYLTEPCDRNWTHVGS